MAPGQQRGLPHWANSGTQTHHFKTGLLWGSQVPAIEWEVRAFVTDKGSWLP